MDAFYASVEQRDRPELRDRPVIVGGLGARGVVAAASYEARRHGVHSAMPMARARRLCPGAEFIAPRIAHYQEVSTRVFEVFHQFTPLVEGLSLDEAFLDVTGSVRLFGDIEAIGRKVRAAVLERTGLHASVGMAPNKFLAKLASDVGKPRGFVVVRPERVREFLDPMPVRRLWGVGPKTEPRLRALGILTMGQLARADPAVLRGALGQRTAHFQALARGEDTREVTAERGEKSLSHEVTFDVDLEDDDLLLAELMRQVEQVGRRLRKDGLAAGTVQVKIRDHRFRTHGRSRSLRAPSCSTRTLFETGRALFRAWRAEHGHTPVRLLGFGVSGLEAAAPGDLVEPSRAQRLDRAFDAVRQRFGSRALSHALSLKSRGKRK